MGRVLCYLKILLVRMVSNKKGFVPLKLTLYQRSVLEANPTYHNIASDLELLGHGNPSSIRILTVIVRIKKIPSSFSNGSYGQEVDSGRRAY